MTDRLTGPLQESILALIATNSEQGRVAASMLTSDQFNDAYQDFAERVIRYQRRHGKAPGAAHLDDLVDDILDNPKHKQHRQTIRIVENVLASADQLNAEYLLTRVGDFAKRQRLKAAITEASDEYVRGEDTAEEVERILTKALRAPRSDMDAGMRLGDSRRTLQFLDRMSVAYSTGQRVLDQCNVGPHPGQILLLIAPKGKGKCIAEGEKVLLADGRHKAIEEVVRDRDKHLVCYDQERGQFRKARIADWLVSGVKPTLLIKLMSGRSIRATREHPLLTEHGWLPASRLAAGTRIAIPWKVPNLGSVTEADHKLRLLGYLLANGSLTKETEVTFSSTDPDIRRDFDLCVKKFKCRTVWERGRGCIVVSRGNGKRLKGHNYILNWMRELGLTRKKSSTKFVPDFVHTLTDKCISIFLSALFSCDLGISAKGDAVEYTSASWRMAKSVEQLLMRLGVSGRYRRFDTGRKSKMLPGYGRLIISTIHDRKRFFDAITFTGRKGAAFFTKSKQPQWQHRKPLNNFTFFDPIKIIEDGGLSRTYDLSVPTHHNFIAGSVIVHNSWFCVEMGKRCIVQGARVVHYTLENPMLQTVGRYYQSFFAIPQDDRQLMLTELKLDELGRLTKLTRSKRQVLITLSDQNIRRSLGRRVDAWSARLNNLIVKEYPSGSLSVAGMDAHLDYLELAEKFVPHVAIVDYPDLMELRGDDKRIALGQTFVDLRGLLQRRRMAGVFVTQGGRATLDARTVRASMVSEDISKVFTSDQVLVFSQTEEEKRLGLARLTVANNRNGRDGFTLVITQSYETGQFMIDSAVMGASYWDIVPANGEGYGGDEQESEQRGRGDGQERGRRRMED